VGLEWKSQRQMSESAGGILDPRPTGCKPKLEPRLRVKFWETYDKLMVYQIKQSQVTGLVTVCRWRGEKITGHFTVTHKNTVCNCGMPFTEGNIIIELNDFKYDSRHKIVVWVTINCLSVNCLSVNCLSVNTLRTGSFKLFKRPLPGFLTILTLETLN